MRNMIRQILWILTGAYVGFNKLENSFRALRKREIENVFQSYIQVLIVPWRLSNYCDTFKFTNLLLQYGLAWGSAAFTFSAALVLICDKEHEEVYYKEKTIYYRTPY